MRYKHGTFESLEGEFGLRGYDRPIERTDRNGQVIERRVLSVQFRIVAVGQAAILARFNQIKAALEKDGVDSGFVHDDGTHSAIFLPNAGSRSGVQVIQAVSIQPQDGADYATGLTGGFTVTADYEQDTLGNPQIDFDYGESVTVNGNGGASFVPIVTDTQQPVLVATALFTPVTMVQQGFAVGRIGWPLPNPPLWANSSSVQLVNPATAVTNDAPKRVNSIFTEYRVSWNYRFLATGPQSGLPLIR